MTDVWRGVGTIAGLSGLERMLTGLLDASHLLTLERLPERVAAFGAEAGLGDVLVYLADLQQTVLRALPPGWAAGEEGEIAELRIDTTLAGRAFQEVRALSQNGGDGEHLWWVPLLDGTERLGVLRVAAEGPDLPEAAGHLAALVALMLVSQRTHSDAYSQVVRTRPMNVAAEMQWRLIPPLTYATPEMTVGGMIEPAYEVGGDVFDYALAGDTLHLALFDAMGHDASAGLTANLAMAACRNHRHQGMDLIVNSQAIERTLIGEFGPATRFVTAVMAELNVRTGQLTWINRGHPPPVLIRSGRWSTTLECPPAHPLGLDLGLPVTVCQEQLEPGDRLLFYTDGIVEAGAAQGREFGLTRFVDFIIKHTSAALPVPETLRRLIRSILDYHDGHLGDDATVLLAEWHGPGAGPLVSPE
ncbi:hypothetical protein Aph01nite_30960 [Acrocarpospora phusangensis]|uniref:PPM-type phosphatase domain-containing protein n=1 Tax=Acrocarpospora phusangensis TaxID=1070424 RepID=A0A919QB49_9ACTN|nr:PP2C family protein-serine/threonine phosphatase [Acrocarpospora phusangensis]GIH24786.1 hypothetical protein Aph01nite_30960 [Acrocarpospora phusangensis]